MKNYIIIYDTDNGQQETHCTAEQLERVKKIINDFFCYKKHLLGKRHPAGLFFLHQFLKNIAKNQSTLSDDYTLHEVMLILKIKVKRALGYSCTLDNVVNRGVFEAFFNKKLIGSIKNTRPFILLFFRYLTHFAYLRNKMTIGHFCFRLTLYAKMTNSQYFF